MLVQEKMPEIPGLSCPSLGVLALSPAVCPKTGVCAADLTSLTCAGAAQSQTSANQLPGAVDSVMLRATEDPKLG